MKQFAMVAGLVLLVTACQSNKKPTADEQAKIQQEFDYRAALQSYKIGINYLNNQEILDAVDHLNRAVELDGGNFRYRHALGLAYSMNGQLEEAITQVKEAIKINEKASESYNLLGTLYTELGRYSDASGALRQAIMDKNYPQPQFPYFNLAVSYEKQGRKEEAIAAYNLAVQFDDKFYRAYIALGEIYKEKKDYKNMLSNYQKAEPAFRNNAEVLFNIGYAFFKLRDFERAKHYLAQVSILFPKPAIDKPTQNMLRYIEKFERDSRN